MRGLHVQEVAVFSIKEAAWIIGNYEALSRLADDGVPIHELQMLEARERHDPAALHERTGETRSPNRYGRRASGALGGLPAVARISFLTFEGWRARPELNRRPPA